MKLKIGKTISLEILVLFYVSVILTYKRVSLKCNQPILLKNGFKLLIFFKALFFKFILQFFNFSLLW